MNIGYLRSFFLPPVIARSGRNLAESKIQHQPAKLSALQVVSVTIPPLLCFYCFRQVAKSCNAISVNLFKTCIIDGKKIIFFRRYNKSVKNKL